MSPRPLPSTAQKLWAVVLLLLLGLAPALPPGRSAAQAGTANLALGALASASSSERADLGPSNAVDGNMATRWSSLFSDPQSFTLDLGARASLDRLVLHWEYSNASGYRVESSDDGSAWTVLRTFSVEPAAGPRSDDLAALGGSGRYLRIVGTARSTPYGYSLYEAELFGSFTEQAVTLAADTATLDEAGAAALTVRLNRPAAAPVTVRYATADGTAVAGRDYVAASGTLTFPAGTTALSVTLSAIDDATDERPESFDLLLSDAGPSGVVIGPRDRTTVRVVDNDDPAYDGATQLIDDFEQDLPIGSPDGLFTFGSDADDNPTLARPQAARAGAPADNHALSVTYNVSGWGGFARNLPTAQDWSAFSGIAFWFKGSATGQTIQFEIKDGGTDGEHAELWETFITDTSSDWRLVRVPFDDFVRRTSYQPGDGPTDGQLNLVEMWGYAMNLPAASGAFLIDHVEVYEQAVTIIDFEGDVPFGSPEGIAPFGAGADDLPLLTVEERPRGSLAGNHALRVDYDVDTGDWGGFVHHISFDTEPQDWSSFKGFRFWWYSANTTPQPPGSGPRIYLELKDGGANAEASELWNTSFTDDFSGWTLIEIPFSKFAYRSDYQPVGGINRRLDLTDMWGYAFTAPPGRPGSFSLDHVQVYGVGSDAPPATIGTSQPAYLADEGQRVAVGVTLTTRDGKPLAGDLTVGYTTEGGSATVGEDYVRASGTLTFTDGMASGAVLTFTVDLESDAAAEPAETVELRLQSPGAALDDDLPALIVINAHSLPYLNPALPTEQRVADLLGRMTLEEKIGQMTQAERGALDSQDDIAAWHLGSLLSGGGSTPAQNTPAAWAAMVDGYQLRAMQTRLQIPLIYGVDAVHGHNNVRGATIFPHNIGLGAARDPLLTREVGALTAKEVRATGIPWDFAPCLCVSRDERWGRTYESFGEDPALVGRMATVVDGLQGSDLAAEDRVLATAKHWVGDGGTTFGSSTTGSYTIDQGVTTMSMRDLRRLHIGPYLPAISKGVGTVMPSYSSVDLTDDSAGPIKMHAHKQLLTDVLKQELGFDGFVITDWQAIDQIPGDYRSDVRTSINAGIDMVMVPYEYQQFAQALLAEVEAGGVPQSRIDDAVRRILRQKFRLGLFERPFANRDNLGAVGAPAHRAVARQAAAQSQVLLKNDGRLLPLSRTASIYVAGSNADNIGNQAGGWTISWQGASGDTTEGSTILDGIREVAPGASVTHSPDASAPTAGHDVGVVVVGETPYAEGVGDIGNGRADLSLSAADRAAVERVCGAMPCAVVVVSGRPQLIGQLLPQAEAVVAAWLPGSEGAGVADALFGLRPYTGRLPLSWPRSMAQLPVNVGDAQYQPLFPYGWGLRTDVARQRLQSARAALAAMPSDPQLRAGIQQIDRALAAPQGWDASGAPRNDGTLLGALQGAARQLSYSRSDVAAQLDVVASVARDVAQAAMAPQGGAPSASGALALSADAEQALMGGDAERAVTLLARAARVVPSAGR